MTLVVADLRAGRGGAAAGGARAAARRRALRRAAHARVGALARVRGAHAQVSITTKLIYQVVENFNFGFHYKKKIKFL